ncbi:MAG: NAD(+)/NADH kinase [Bacteroidales bacterium]|nr:NAD(+)/NADH kinase [Bacteroidales bacterium]
MSCRRIILYSRQIGSHTGSKLDAFVADLVYHIKSRGVSVGIAPSDDLSDIGEADAIMSLGGDGTFLEAARWSMKEQVPILGINSGRLGFMAEVDPGRALEAIDRVIDGDYRIAERDVLTLTTDDGVVDYALNEFAVSKCDNASMLTITAKIDGEFLANYWADGLIVATATGSTAYSLSVGGPIAMPASKNFIITPIAPHNLSLRPLVVPNTSEIDLHVEGRGQHILTSMDGRNHVMQNGCNMRITPAPFKVKVITLGWHTFFEAMRDKLMWGADARNPLVEINEP